MTDPYGIIDLAALKKPATAGGSGGGGVGDHEIAVTEQGLEQIIQDSNRVPTLLVVTSARVPEGEEFVSALRRHVDARAGAVRLATVDADSQSRVAEALRVRQLPTLMLMLKGQIQPIIESVLPEAEIPGLLDQVVQVAQQQGMETPEPEQPQEPEQEPLSPLLQEAYDAIESGDLDAAVAAFDSQLQQTPGDAEAKAGLSTVRLMRRTRGADLDAARTAAAERREDLDAQLLVADLDVLGGHLDDAFTRLLDLMRTADPESKNTLRTRLLELFEIAGGDDPRVVAARKRLANLLY